jgi:hypothetical protein
MSTAILCPRCKNKKEKLPALSRRDNETMICNECGINEAIIDLGATLLDEKNKKGVLIIDGVWLPTKNYQKYLEQF